MKRIVLVLGLGLCATQAGAQSSTRIALALGELLGSEQACGLAFDQPAIEAFIAKNAPADDLRFASTMNTSASVTPDQIEGMTQSQRTAHCAQIRRVAKAYGFVK